MEFLFWWNFDAFQLKYIVFKITLKIDYCSHFFVKVLFKANIACTTHSWIPIDNFQFHVVAAVVIIVASMKEFNNYRIQWFYEKCQNLYCANNGLYLVFVPKRSILILQQNLIAWQTKYTSTWTTSGNNELHKLSFP